MTAKRSCPCLYLKQPCHDRCTCVNLMSSSGCLNCCTYGSLEQRTRRAEILNEIRLFAEQEVAKALEDKKSDQADVSDSLGFDEGYSKGYSDAQREAAQEIREHYHPNDR